MLHKKMTLDIGYSDLCHW